MEQQNNGGMSGIPVWGGEGSASSALPSPPTLRRSGRQASLAAVKAEAEAKEAAERQRKMNEAAAAAHAKQIAKLAEEELKPKKVVPSVNSPQVSLATTRVGAKPHGLFENKKQPSSVNNPFLGTGPGSYSGLPHPPSRFGWGTAAPVPISAENQDDELGNLAGSMGKMGMGGNSRRRKSTSRKSKKCNYRKSRRAKRTEKSRKTSRRN